MRPRLVFVVITIQMLKKPIKKVKRSTLKTKLDKVVSLFIRARDKKCVICGSTEGLSNGHVFSRTSLNTRWDITPDGNCHAQCWSCNYRHSSRDSYPYFNWYIKKFGQKKFDELHKRFSITTHLKDWQLVELYEQLKEKGI
jgi:hypothetical protein